MKHITKRRETTNISTLNAQTRRRFWRSGRVNSDPNGPAPRAIELGEEHALPSPEVRLSAAHRKVLRLTEEACEKVRVAVALGVLEGDVQSPHERSAGGCQIPGHVRVVVFVDRYAGGGVGRGDHAESLPHAGLPHGLFHLPGDGDEFVALVR